MEKHTPGPWLVGPEYYDNPKGDMKAVWSGSFANTAHSVARHVKPEDAHLIAASPEMLKALVYIRAIMSSPHDVTTGERQAIERLCRETLAKAEGRQL